MGCRVLGRNDGGRVGKIVGVNVVGFDVGMRVGVIDGAAGSVKFVNTTNPPPLKS